MTIYARGVRALADRAGSTSRPSVAFSSLALDDRVDHAVLEQELGALEALGQLLADGLLDDARPGEADERLRLGEDDVAQHGERRRHAARRRVQQHRDVRQPRLWSRASAAVVFAICMSDRMPSCMRAPPEAEKMIAGTPPLERALEQARDLLADHRAHRAAHELEHEEADRHRRARRCVASPSRNASATPDLLLRARAGDRRSASSRETRADRRAGSRVLLDEAALVDGDLDALLGRHDEVEAALRAAPQ